MPISDLVPVILCGGSGTRLWPLSRPERPKQFHALTGAHSLLQQTVMRARQVSEAAPVIVTGGAHGDMVRAQLAEIGIAPECVIDEPCARNTAPAIALAGEYLRERRPGSVMWVLPSDHVIGDVASLAIAAAAAESAARQGYLVTFGVRPTAPHTGYGYIRSGAPVDGLAGVFGVSAFLEKPDQTRAEAFLASGDYYWNSGMFVLAAADFLDELVRLAPAVAEPVAAAWRARLEAVDMLSPAVDQFAAAEAISIDYAVMERTDRAAVVPLDAQWSDIGSWATIWELQDKDSDDNAMLSPAVAVDSRRCYVRAGKPVALVGVEDLVVVETEDAILVCHRDRAEQVKLAAGGMARPSASSAHGAGPTAGDTPVKPTVKADLA